MRGGANICLALSSFSTASQGRERNEWKRETFHFPYGFRKLGFVVVGKKTAPIGSGDITRCGLGGGRVSPRVGVGVGGVA